MQGIAVARRVALAGVRAVLGDQRLEVDARVEALHDLVDRALDEGHRHRVALFDVGLFRLLQLRRRRVVVRARGVQVRPVVRRGRDLRQLREGLGGRVGGALHGVLFALQRLDDLLGVLQQYLPDVAVALRRVERFVVRRQDLPLVAQHVVLVALAVRREELGLVVLLQVLLGKQYLGHVQRDGPALALGDLVLAVDGIHVVALVGDGLGDLVLRHVHVSVHHHPVDALPDFLIAAGRGGLHQFDLIIGEIVLTGLGQLRLDQPDTHEILDGVGGGLRPLLVRHRFVAQRVRHLDHRIQRALHQALGVGIIPHSHDDGIVRIRERRAAHRQAQREQRAQQPLSNTPIGLHGSFLLIRLGLNPCIIMQAARR